MPSDGLVLLGAELDRDDQGRSLVRIVGQNPPPDPDRAVLWRSVRPSGGQVVFTLDGREHTATWSRAHRAWVAHVPGPIDDGVLRVAAGQARDGAGNTTGQAYVLDRAGGIAPPDWPDHIGVGGGRTPGPFGEGTFPP